VTQESAYADLEIRIFKREDAGYPVVLTLRLPDGRQQDSRGYLAPDFIWRRRRRPRENGERLFDLLFADPKLREEWIEMRGLSQQRRIRLHFDDTAPELHALPWEFLHDTTVDPSQPLAALTDTPFSRYLTGGLPSGIPINERPVRLLVAIAAAENLEKDHGLAGVKVDVEQKNIWRAISDLTQGQVELKFLPQPVTRSSLDTALRDGYHILHIVGHGKFYKDDDTEETLLYLADEGCQAVTINEKRFAEMLSRHRQRGPKLIFLASCETAKWPTGSQAETESNPLNAFRGFAPELVKAGVPAVLAMQDVVQIPTARAFARTFYRQLFRHGLVDLASNEARAAVLTADLPGSSVPVIFSRLPSGQLLVQPEEGTEPVVERLPFEPETVHIPEGPFWMGSEPDGVPEYETPQHEVPLPPYEIGKYPVTNEQYAEFVRQTRRPVHPEADWVGHTPPTDKLNHPVMGVTWYDALEYCKWLSKETGRQYGLPSEAQWEKAARGTDGRRYPWGEEWGDGRCNHSGDQTTPVDAYPQGVSHYDCYDMVGNVREWTRSLWGRRMIAPDPEFGYPWHKTGVDRNDLSARRNVYRVYRGGGAADDKSQLRCSARNGFDPTKTGDPGKRHGFRVMRKLPIV